MKRMNDHTRGVPSIIAICVFLYRGVASAYSRTTLHTLEFDMHPLDPSIDGF